MQEDSKILAFSAAITAVIQLGGFAVAYALKTEVFYDILGGINFLALCIYSAIDGSSANSWSDDPRKISFSVIFSCSRLWLLLFLAWRAHERGGDSRFDEVKENFFVFLFYWIFQAVWVFSISLPLLLVNSSDHSAPFSVFDYTTIIGFGIGVVLEVSADIQKTLWVKAGRQGNFCQVGVWKYSRHPNYFGEILQWWSAWGFSYRSGSGFGDVQFWIGILSPLITMQILLFTSGTGVANANGKGLKRYYIACPEEYSDYRKKTSILIPMIGYKYVPLFLKRTVFLDLKSYEYTPEEVDDTLDKVKEGSELPENYQSIE
jgi:steroid 5-alpha reductase family enzyme